MKKFWKTAEHTGKKIKEYFGKVRASKVKLAFIAAAVSLVTTVSYHVPFFSYVGENTDNDFNGAVLFVSIAALMLALNYFACYLTLWLGRAVGKGIAAAAFICNAVTLYFINTYNVLIDDSMMGNVFNTKFSEASGFWSWNALWYILLAGILPAAILLLIRIDYGSFKRFLANVAASLALITAIPFANMSNWMWIDRNATVMGSLIMPWSYVVNSVRYAVHERERNKPEIKLPDAVIADDCREAVILVIGESARRDHFSLYGYERPTNPLLSAQENLTAYEATSNGTCTIDGVKAIISHTDSREKYEILPNYLYRTGVDVIWRTSNWGQSTLEIGDYKEIWTIAGEKPELNPNYDETLFDGLWERIASSDSSKVLAVLHTSTSHGPAYDEKYPESFRRWTPVPTTVEMSKCPDSDLVNAYDNSILYTDWLLNEIIEHLKGMPDRKTTLIYVSDHGESLGEGGWYMHGLPLSVAPACQYEIPFLVWTSDPQQKYKDAGTLSQFHVFHSILHFLGIESPVYDENLNIYE